MPQSRPPTPHTRQDGPPASETRGADQLAARRGFSLIDLLVAISVVALLISLLMPSISGVRESSRRIVCASNLRQHGLALHMYGNDWRGILPPSVFLSGRWGMDPPVQEMVTVRTDPGEFGYRPWGEWDGLGLLFASDYMPAPGAFYCPSHTGAHPFDRYADRWHRTPGEIISNYHFRGAGPDGNRFLFSISPDVAISTDGLREPDDYNHRVGFNVLRAGLAVNWFADGDNLVSAALGTGGGVDTPDVNEAWRILDGPKNAGPTGN